MYEEVKRRLEEIIEIVKSVPEPFQHKCFEILFAHSLESLAPVAPKPEQVLAPPKRPTLAAQVKLFLNKYKVEENDLWKVVTVMDNEVYFLKDPKPKQIARGQIEWALLIALKSVINTNKFEVDPEAVRSMCIEKGYYDKRNFATNFKKKGNAALFKGVLAPQGEPKLLSDRGLGELAKLITLLAKQET